MAHTATIGREQPQTTLNQITWLSDQLGELSNLITREELDAILRKAAVVFVEAAQNKLISGGHVLSGDLVDSVGIIERKKGRKLSRVIVGPRYYGGYKGQIAHIVEYGSYISGERFRSIANKAGLTNRKIKQRLLKQASTGVMPAAPFMRPAFDENKQKVMDFVTKEITKLIIEKAKKQGLEAA